MKLFSGEELDEIESNISPHAWGWKSYSFRPIKGVGTYLIKYRCLQCGFEVVRECDRDPADMTALDEALTTVKDIKTPCVGHYPDD